MKSPTKLMMSLLLLFAMNPSGAFTSRPRTTASNNLVQLSAASVKPPSEKSYGETSRKFRRSFFTHKDWLKHRSEDRFVRNLVSIVESGVVRQLAKEIGFVVATATFVVAWNCLLGEGFVDFTGVKHDPIFQGLPLMKLPIEPFTLSSPALGLLLGK